MKHQIHTDIDIDASQESVRRIQPPGGKATSFKPTVTEMDPEHTFEWLADVGSAS